jgi:phage terminase large subunit
LLIFDPKNPNDCLTEPHELTHAPDSLRYFCSSWTYAPSYIPTEKKDNWIQKAIKNNQKINNDGNGEFVTWY